MKPEASAKIQLIGSMLIFATIGFFVRYIPLASGAIALVRGAVGALFLVFLLAVVLLRRQKPDLVAIKSRSWLLLASGACIGFNWILLFEAYRHTSIATATLCYYCAPLFVVLAAPLVAHEKLTVRRLLCVGAAVLGMLGVSGILGSGLPSADELTGILCGLGAAVLYASVMLLNKHITGLTPEDKTVSQLSIAAVVLLPYCLLTNGFAGVGELSTLPLILLLVVGILHTGFAYRLYFGAIGKLQAQTTAIFSYIDPAAAILLSLCIPEERAAMTVFSVIGAVLILGAALISELPEKTKT